MPAQDASIAVLDRLPVAQVTAILSSRDHGRSSILAGGIELRYQAGVGHTYGRIYMTFIPFIIFSHIKDAQSII